MVYEIFAYISCIVFVISDAKFGLIDFDSLNQCGSTVNIGDDVNNVQCLTKDLKQKFANKTIDVTETRNKIETAQNATAS